VYGVLKCAYRSVPRAVASATQGEARSLPPDGHPNVALLKTLARVINEEAGIEELEADGDWFAA
jgi:hypothetical protein